MVHKILEKIKMIYIGFLFFIISGMCEAVMDTLQFHYESSYFFKFKNRLFWDPSVSWKNKYKDGDPTNGERFFLSKTLLVGLTDGWHLFKLFRTFFLFGGVFFIFLPCSTPMVCLTYVMISRILFGISFTLFYDKLSF